jgi:serine/threonine-protein kinase RsbT
MNDDATKTEVSNNIHASIAAEKTEEIAKKLGFSECDQTKIAIATSELARNIVVHANGKGKITINPIKEPDRAGIMIMAEDQGPGMSSVKKVLQENNGSKKGLGAGLSGTRRLMDEFNIESKVGEGTTVIAKKWKKQSLPKEANY